MISCSIVCIVDESSALDALQTLADISLNYHVPLSAGDSGKIFCFLSFI